MYKQFWMGLLLLATTTTVQAQVLQTKAGQIRFFSSTPTEDIEATNNQAVSKLDTKTGAMQFMVLIKGFRFENELMQQHFNDDYLESSKFPKGEFKGKITNIAAINFAKDGTYPATAEGDLIIHGVTKKTKATGSITITKGKVSLKSVFKIKITDFNISGSEIGKAIAKELEITVTAAY